MATGQCGYQATRPMQFVHDKTALANRRLRKEEQAATLTTYHSGLSVQISHTREFFAIWTFLVDPTKAL